MRILTWEQKLNDIVKHGIQLLGPVYAREILEEITRLRSEIEGFEVLSETHQAEIARLRAGLEVFSFTDNWTTFGEPRTDGTNVWQWDHPVLVPDPAAFACQVLEGNP